jgi:hypothetical protein
VTVRGGAVKNGDVALAALEDVTQNVAVELTSTAYDATKHDVTVGMRIKNTSKDTIRAPIGVRAVTLLSSLGAPRAMNADGGGASDGAIWWFSSQVSRGALAPNEQSAPRSLVFHLDDVRPGAVAQADPFGILQIEARVFSAARLTPVQAAKAKAPSPKDPP